VEGNRNTSDVAALRTARTPAIAGASISAKALDRWSSVGISTARRKYSGILVGPGMKTGFCMVAPPRSAIGGNVAVVLIYGYFFEKYFH
jgi:hypothetical protein